jgi:hypothetical protein
MKRVFGVVAVLLTIGLLASAALANQGGGKGEGKGRGEGRREGGPPGVVFGTLKSKNGNTWTIKPEIPPHMRERMEDKGREMPKLPDSITVTVSDQTKFWLDGAASSAKAFETGTQIVVKLDKPAREGGSKAVAVADPETARQYILEKMKERGGPGGEGGPGGPDGERRGPRLIFGTVSSVSGSSMTVKPEVPDFLKDMLPNKGEKLGKFEGKLPESISVSLDSQTKYVVDKQEQSSNPFKSGDKVAILPEGQPGSATARIVSDYASAKARMQERKEKRQEKREGKGQGKGKGKNKG